MALRYRNASTLIGYLRWVPQQLIREFYQMVIVKGVIANKLQLDQNKNFEFGFNTFEINPRSPNYWPYTWPEREQ
ncbi:unnamed protein product [Gongylonema pulchrum]|uniref:ABC transporter permease n=1 Tax=Gongylonema pulchrum TaxID=637853 RepID=A0A183D917_9BILA|nr:unnamed protein product [Gongylonema pulchrum]